ncbi:response regulator [uncultured Jatrophihabitans sp.]|uniref:response regulator n=1 Tax=uncultured Jatrophihabitans sp. TaxID=1610747 RepID=UPI0035CB9D1E
MIRLVLADDQAVVRDGLVLLLTASGEIDVVGTAADGSEAVAQVVRNAPDVALLDLRMPVMDGAEATAALTRQCPDVAVLILTTFADDDAVLPALRAGAVGYLTKDATGEELVGAIRDVAAGHTVLDPGVQKRLVELLRAAPPPPGTASPQDSPSAPSEEAEGLTRREVDVVRLVADGLSNTQIARRLVVSEATVKTHLNHVLSKLAVDGRSGLVAWAWRNGLGGS